MFDNHGHINEEGIALYAEKLNRGVLHELAPKLLEHAEDCLECKQSILEAANTLKDIQEHKESLHTKPTHRLKLLVSIAASILIIATLSIIVKPYFANSNSQDENSFLAQQDSISVDTVKYDRAASSLTNEDVISKLEITDETTKKENDLYAANFEESPHFEALVNARYRSATGISISTPSINKIFTAGSKIKFSWESEKKESLILRLYCGNDPIPIYSQSEIQDNYMYTTLPNPGLYYWKLESEEELYFVGKFLVH